MIEKDGKAQVDRDAAKHEKIMQPSKLQLIQSVVAYLWLPISIFFLEIVMAASTNGLTDVKKWIYLFLFSASYGTLLCVITVFIRHNWLRFAIESILLFLFCFFYAALYFLYCEFRIFYDFNTMFSGASDAALNFKGDIISMISSEDGIWHIVLFMLPFVLFLVFGWMLVRTGEHRLKKGLATLLAAVTLLLLTFCVICTPEEDRNAILVDYNYQDAIQRFGVMTAVCKEAANVSSDSEEPVSFDLAGEALAITANENAQVEDKNTDKENLAEKKETKVSAAKKASETKVPDNLEKIDSPKREEKKIEKNEIEIDFAALWEEKGTQNAELDAYVMAQEASSKNDYTGLFKGKNLIFITAEAFTAEVINREMTPTLYRLATRGIQFTDYYQPASAGTTGGEYANLFGMLPTAGGSSVKKTQSHYNWSTMASRLTEEGYYGKAYHNNDYTYYDRHKTHINLGFSDGYEGKGNGLEDVITSQWPESDLEMMKGTLSSYIKKEPFYIYYMSVSGHSLYTFGKNAMAKKHREEVENSGYSEPVQAYLACQLEFEDAMEYLVGQLERLHMADDTVIVISADHFPYGLDQDSGELTYLQELYGQKIEDNLYRDHNRLIIWSGCLEKESPIVVDSPTSSMDILPTLCNLFGVRFDSRLLPGRDVFSEAEPLVFDLGYDWKTDKGTYIAAKGKFTPAAGAGEVSKEYIERMQTIVRNKITYSKAVLNQDYFRYLFEEKKQKNKDEEAKELEENEADSDKTDEGKK